MHVLNTSILKSVTIILGMQEFTIREQEGMALNEENIVKNFLRFGHVRRRPIEEVVKS